MAEQNVFWYYAGNKPQNVIVSGVPSLVSPHFYVLAPPTQQWPAHCAHLFKRRQPPADVLKRFGESGRLAMERQKQIQQESVRANAEANEKARAQAAAARRGDGAEAMSFPQAIEEKGKSDPAKQPPSESSQSSPKKRETRAEKKARLKAEKEAVKQAAEEAKEAEEEQDEDNQ
jgi:hypothetical protein